MPIQVKPGDKIEYQQIPRVGSSVTCHSGISGIVIDTRIIPQSHEHHRDPYDSPPDRRVVAEMASSICLAIRVSGHEYPVIVSIHDVRVTNNEWGYKNAISI